jgi:hypothetical protein
MLIRLILCIRYILWMLGLYMMREKKGKDADEGLI